MATPTVEEEEWKKWVEILFEESMDFSEDLLKYNTPISWGWWKGGGGWIISTQFTCSSSIFVDIKKRLEHIEKALIQEGYGMELRVEPHIEFYDTKTKMTHTMRNVFGYSDDNRGPLPKNVTTVTTYTFFVTIYTEQVSENYILNFKKFIKNI